MAIACFLLRTRPPFPLLPDRKVPCLRRRMALATRFFELGPYRAIFPPPLLTQP
jgi:hypothetical protein